MSYVECPKCGQRALSVATQCPHCGLDFTAEHPKHPVVEEEVPRLRRRLQVAGVLLVVVFVLVGIALALYQSGSQEGLTPPPATPVDSAPSKPSQPATEKSDKLADTARPVTPAPSTDTARAAPPAPSVAKPPAAEPSLSRVDTTRPAPPAPSTAPPPGNELLQRWARMWVNVRKARRPDAAIVRVLKPGEPVLVDSLRAQWYRVLIDGRPVGYVYRGYVSATPP
jgi:rRNA maturation protein Nop10